MSSKILLHLRQIKSPIRRQKYQYETLKGLGLKKINSRSILNDTPSIRGMINKIKHLIYIEKHSE